MGAPKPTMPDIAAGILLGAAAPSDRTSVVAEARDRLTSILGSSALWVPGRLPPEVRGDAAYGDDLPRYRPVTETPDQQAAIAAAWSAVLAAQVPGDRRFLRLRVDTSDDVRRVRELGSVDGLELAASLDSPGGDRGFDWRWPFRVGVLPGPAAGEWLAAVQNTSHHGFVFDAEAYDSRRRYEIVLAEVSGLVALSSDAQAEVTANACVIVAGDTAPDQLLAQLELASPPAITAAFAGHPSRWWGALFHEMSHDLPLDVAVEVASRSTGVDALLAGPLRGLDVTAPMRWFAAVGPDYSEMASHLDELAGMDWTHEDGAATTTSFPVRTLRDQGQDPKATVRGVDSAGAEPVEADVELDGGPGMGEGIGEGIGEGVGEGVGDGLDGADADGWAEAEPPLPEADIEEEPAAEPAIDEEPVPEPPPPPEEVPEPPAQPLPRRLVTRVRDGASVVELVLPPHKELKLLVRIAVPEQGDTADAQGEFRIPAEAKGPTVPLEVVVSSDVWAEQPKPQPILLSRQRPEQPSTWAAFAFTTPAEGEVVCIEITVFYQGKPLQAATYVSPVREAAVDPDERPTLTVHNLSGPDEPTDDLRPVEVVLDGTGPELFQRVDSTRKVLITDVQEILDAIEELISRVTSDDRASETLDDQKSAELLITLARIGVQLRRKLRPLGLDDAPSIDVMVSDSTPVFPLELAYAGPAPLKDQAQVCQHVDTPPAPGEGCDRASEHVVCPYAFWGLNRTISRTVVWDGPPLAPDGAEAATDFSVLYASTAIADEGAHAPVPGDQVLAAAKKSFAAVKRVKTWKSWRKEIERRKPRLLVILGHAVVVGTDTSLFIGRNSSIAGVELTGADLRIPPSPRPLVLLIACKSAVIGNAFGTLPGVLTSEGAGAVVGTMATITGPAGATATVHLLEAFHEAAGTNASVGDVVAKARRSLLAEKRLMGLILVSHGELDTTVQL